MDQRIKARSDIQERTFEFAGRIVKMCQAMYGKGGVGRVLVDQVLRSGTSIGANVHEAQAAQSKADFIAKMSIAHKETRETSYWIRLLGSTNVIPAITPGRTYSGSR